MKHDETIQLLKSGKLTRRQMNKVLASAGVGVVASSMLPRQAAAEEVNLTLLEWNASSTAQRTVEAFHHYLSCIVYNIYIFVEKIHGFLK